MPGAEDHDGGPASELEVDELDDRDDRDELRDRYYGLLQELRVALPGVQVLLAFLFAVPFAEGFGALDRVGRATFATAMVSSLLAVICMLAPTAMHRFGARTARRARLTWSIRMTMVGMSFLALALSSALWTIARMVFDVLIAVLVTGPVVVGIAGLWWFLPWTIGRAARRERAAR